MRPLPKIPNCCLPQESGPCLSPSLAGHPLRPATDRRLGRPVPHQLANRPRAPHPALLRAFLPGANRGSHAVLAPLSRGYPPPDGRSPTCYSAVRHSRPKPRVRLACFRHAASVDPEPGSNSPSLILTPDCPAGPAGPNCCPGPSPHHSAPVNVPAHPANKSQATEAAWDSPSAVRPPRSDGALRCYTSLPRKLSTRRLSAR